MKNMTTPRRYSRPPIAEAIINFQVDLPEGVRLSDLERCQDAAYPIKKDWVVDRGTVSGSLTPGQVGFLFSSADPRQFYRVHLHGFSVHRVTTYPGWDPFRDEARRLWDLYRRETRPQKVTRLAVRYLHRLDLPVPVKDLKDYLRTFPEVALPLPQEMAGFFMEANVPQPDLKGTLLLREVLAPIVTPAAVSVVLDIDLVRSDEIPADEGGIWAVIESLHTRKEDIFEASITDRTREVIA
jgi:uncharacterized protein (TIGR04255 family)